MFFFKKNSGLALLICLYLFLGVGIGGAVSGDLNAKFSVVPSTGAVPLDVSFIDMSEGNISGWNWSFGDGYSQNITGISLNNSTSILHRYDNPGLYNVTLFVYNMSNLSENSTAISIEGINVSSSPLQANFTAVSVRDVAPFNAQFIDTSGGVPVAWTWTFGDESGINEQGPNHTYVTPGVYNVSLKAFNDTGSSNQTNKPGYITALSPTVTAQMAFVYADPSNPRILQFFDKSDGVGINNWTWDFGDMTNVSHLQNPVHEYEASGRFTLGLSVSNEYATSDATYELGIR